MRLTALALTAFSLACVPASLKLGEETDPEESTTDTGTTAEPTTSGGSTMIGASASDGDPSAGDTMGPEVGNPAGICDPSNSPDCPTDYICCSDDPATAGGKTPNFFSDGLVNEEYGEPIFAGENNERGTWGRCVDVGEFPSPFANGCAVPCNPTWDQERQADICGVSTVCCQFTEIDPAKDCIIDPETQLWRAVTGLDIPALTDWGDSHATNQDRYGSGCSQFATDMGVVDQPALEDCYQQLTVADQRGFCLHPSACPCREDLCDMRNPGYVPRCP